MVDERAATETPIPWRWADAVAWTLIPVIVLASLRIGFVSGDGIAQSELYRLGTWYINPNHLLYEPVSALWFHLGRVAFPDRPAPDVLKLLSILAGGVAVGLFRAFLADSLATARWQANLATAWFAFGGTFAGLWISDEPQMIQMPWLVLMAIATAAYVRTPRKSTALALGAAGGAASAFYISNVLVAAATGIGLAVWLARTATWRRAVSALALTGAGGAAVTVPVFAVAWKLSAPPGLGPLRWLTSYGGGHVESRSADAYGIHLSLHELMVAFARAVYGASATLVDVSNTVDAWRAAPVVTVGGVADIAALLVVFAGACVAVRAILRSHAGSWRTTVALIITTTWVTAIMLFGIYWNNSDDQFYFQLAVPIGVVIAAIPASVARSTALLIPTLVLAVWTIVTTVHERIAYPRDQIVTAIARATKNAALVIYPGEDDPAKMLYFVRIPGADHRIALTTLARRNPVVTGVQVLRDTIASTLARNGCVLTIATVDAPDNQNPWKYLSAFGYTHSVVMSVLVKFSPDPRPVLLGPFESRWIRPSANANCTSSAR